MNEFRELAEAAQDPRFIEKKAGQTIVEQGEKGNFMFVVEKGTARIMADGVVLEEAGSGDIVGEMALIDNAPRSARIVAGTDCRLIPISKWRFLHLVRKDPAFSIHVMQVMNRRLREMNQRLARAGQPG